MPHYVLDVGEFEDGDSHAGRLAALARPATCSLGYLRRTDIRCVQQHS